jgi:spore germination protein GerM
MIMNVPFCVHSLNIILRRDFVSRGLVNILIVIIIGFLATPIPINSEGIDLGLSLDNVSNVAIEENSSTTVVDNSTDNYVFNGILNSNLNPKTLKLVIQSIDTELQTADTPEFFLELVSSSGQSKEFSPLTYEYEGFDDNTKTYTYNIDISKETLNVDSGFYKIYLKSNSSELSETLNIEEHVQYLTDVQYIGSEDKVSKSKMYLKLYLPTKDLKYTVPVSRINPYSNVIIRRTMTAITEGAKENSGLYQGDYLPYASSLKFRKDNITVNFYSRNLEMYKDNSILSNIAVKSLADTLTNITWLPEVERINVTVDKKPSKDYFNGYDLTGPIEKNNKVQLYLPYETDSYLYLLPQDANISNDEINDLFDNLKMSRPDFMSLIPEDVNLISYFFEENTLILNLSADPTESYANRPDIANMIVESILFTYTELDNIESVKINVSNSNVVTMGTYNIQEALKAPNFINVEK